MEETKFCPRCGKQVSGDASFCPNCGYNFNESNGNNPQFQNFSSQQTYTPQPQPKTNGNTDYSMLTLVFGILALVLGGILWGILGLVFSSNADKNDTKTKVGKVLSITGIVIWVIVFVVTTVVLVIGAPQARGNITSSLNGIIQSILALR